MTESDSKSTDAKFSSARRAFVKLAAGGAALMTTAEQASAKLTPIPPGIKIGVERGSTHSGEPDLPQAAWRDLGQLGAEPAECNLGSFH